MNNSFEKKVKENVLLMSQHKGEKQQLRKQIMALNKEIENLQEQNEEYQEKISSQIERESKFKSKIKELEENIENQYKKKKFDNFFLIFVSKN